jgi:hypothetical protein
MRPKKTRMLRVPLATWTTTIDIACHGMTISDIGDFKKYRFSYLILEYALCLWQNCAGKSKEEPFRMIRDYIELGTADTEFPRTLQELVVRYPSLTRIGSRNRRN